jgi:sterol desaturase/sphingolipid hydroxylase (fatty acid hydroxylase superfamily)
VTVELAGPGNISFVSRRRCRSFSLARVPQNKNPGIHRGISQKNLNNLLLLAALLTGLPALTGLAALPRFLVRLLVLLAWLIVVAALLTTLAALLVLVLVLIHRNTLLWVSHLRSTSRERHLPISVKLRLICRITVCGAKKGKRN